MADEKRLEMVIDMVGRMSNRYLRAIAVNEVLRIPLDTTDEGLLHAVEWMNAGQSANFNPFNHAEWLRHKERTTKTNKERIIDHLDHPNDKEKERKAWASCAVEEALQCVFMPSNRSVMSLCGFVRALTSVGDTQGELERQIADCRAVADKEKKRWN